MFAGKCIVLLVILQIEGTFPASLSDSEGLEFARDIADELSKTFKSLLNKYTNYENITSIYEEYSKNGSFISKDVDGELINKNFKEKIEKLFNTKASQLHKIKSKAENLKTNYQYMNNLTHFNYINVQDVDKNPSLVTAVTTFSSKVQINVNESFVQVPTNVYSKSVKVLNTAKWTLNLDEVFKENFNDHSDPMMLYQLYCDSTGVFRIFPGNRNGYEKDKVDFYDCRRRVWYSQASASPKDVVIVLDMSGSMMGKNKAIARMATETLLDTLQENDYFNIITINNTFRYVCCNYLIQATKENKEFVKKQLLRIPKPTETINITKGVEEAFKILNSGPSHNRTSAKCNKVIMVLSDGVEGSYAAEKIFEKYNKDKTVRAFAYMIGRNGDRYRQALKTMACKNNGAFYSIETYGNIWDTMLEYLNVLSRPIARKRASHISFSPIYLDSTGLGMILTASIGIFHNDRVTGVAGIDITISSFKGFVPNEELGVFSHLLVVNNNGFVILHPLLNEQTGYLPAPPNVYLEDIVRATNPIDSVTLKHSMVDRNTSSQVFDVYLPFDDYRRLWRGEVTYYYCPIEDRDFSSAIGISAFDKYQYTVDDTLANRWIQHGIEALNSSWNNTIIQITQWRYCNITAESHQTQPKSIVSYPKVHEIYNFLKNVKQVKDIPKECNSGLVKNLLTTAGIATTYVNNTWSNVLNDDDEHIKSMFIFASGGFSKLLRRDSKLSFERDIYQTTIYKQATINTNASVILSTQIRSNGNFDEPNVLMAGVSKLSTDKNRKLISTVLGIEVTNQYVNSILENVTSTYIKSSNNKNFDCKQTNDILCVIIDYNAYVVASNRGEKNNGRLLLEIAGQLLEHLTNISVFETVVLNDTQAECKNTEENTASASNILQTPLRTMSHLFRFICGSTYWLFFEAIATAISFSDQVKTSEEESYSSCTRELTLFRFNEAKWNENKTSSRELQCSKTCIQKFAISPIPDTNLLFLVADLPCPECTISGIKTNQSNVKFQTQPYGDPCSGFCSAKEKYRRRPQHCYKDSKNENAFACKGHMAKPTSLLNVITICFIFWLYIWR